MYIYDREKSERRVKKTNSEEELGVGQSVMWGSGWDTEGNIGRKDISIDDT